MTYAELKAMEEALLELERRCSDAKIRSYLSMAIARTEMLCRRWEKRGTFAPDTHPKRAATR